MRGGEGTRSELREAAGAHYERRVLRHAETGLTPHCGHGSGLTPTSSPGRGLGSQDRDACYSPFSRFAPSMMECHPYTSDTMNPSIWRSPGALSLTVDL
jgi:hypothetical protein